MFFSKWTTRGVGGTFGGRREGARRQRPTLALGERTPELEPRVVPTVIYGPIASTAYNVTTTFTEVAGVMVAHISLAANAASAVSVEYDSYSNATAAPTSAGDHNNGNQRLMAGVGITLQPGQSINLFLGEGARGTYHSGQADQQTTGTQFDVFIDPVGDSNGNQRVLDAAVIAYNPLLPPSS